MSSNTTSVRPVRVAILGAGGLGRGMARLLSERSGLQLLGLVDSNGYAFEPDGLIPLNALEACSTVADLPGLGVACDDAIITFLQTHGSELDALFLALPNLPVDFYATTVEAILEKTPFRGVMVDALKRVKAVELLARTDAKLKEKGVLYITGCGATPGFLTTVAAVAAQSFVSVEKIDIRFGVGVANWESYRATIKEDFLQLPEFTAEQVAAMSDAEIEAELDKRNGLLELVNMEHADSLLLEWAGICAQDKVTVGGLVDTRNAQKPITTTVTVLGKTVFGQQAEHRFEVSNATTMVDNVCGPAAGFMLQGFALQQQGWAGLASSLQIMPAFAPATIAGKLNPQPQQGQKPEALAAC